MSAARRTVSAALATTLLGTGISALALPATAAAPTTCQGQPVTITGPIGTEGDDVMALEPGQFMSAQGLGGDDLICIAAAPLDGFRTLALDAGPGDDRVFNESTDVDAVSYITVLGAGADSYRGIESSVPSDPGSTLVTEEVFAGTRDPQGNAMSGATDTEADTIVTGGGDDVVYSGSTAVGALNPDVVRTGSGEDTAHWAGEQTWSTLDLGTDANLVRLYPGWRATSVVVDAGERLATGDGRRVLRWTGDVVDVRLQLDNRDVTFVGTDADESVVMGEPYGNGSSLPAGGSRTALLGGGEDFLILSSTGAGTIDGGPGLDHVYSGSCWRVRARLGGTFTCASAGTPEVSHTFDFVGWEDLLLKGHDISVRGSDGAEKMKVVAARIRVQGLGGADVLNPNLSAGSEAYDKPVVVSGGRGDDRVLGTPGTDVLRGGPGDDRLFGQRGDDTMQGGTGRDKAVGADGRDRCAAEVRRSCEG